MEAVLAKFKERLVENVSLKYVVVNVVTTFQLQWSYLGVLRRSRTLERLYNELHYSCLALGFSGVAGTFS